VCHPKTKRNSEHKAIEFHHMEKIADNPARRLDEDNILPLCPKCQT
jgi:hypothetical protein